MAIRFVEVKSGEAERPRVQQAAARRQDPEPRTEDMSAGEHAVKLPLAKPEPKPRGRKKPLR